MATREATRIPSVLYHKQKKREDENTGRIFGILVWTWIIGGSRTENTSKQQNMVDFMTNCLVKMTFMYSQRLVSTLMQFRRLLHIKKIIVNASCLLQFLNSQNISKGWLLGHLWRSYKSCRSCTEKRAITGPWWVLFTMEVR